MIRFSKSQMEKFDQIAFENFLGDLKNYLIKQNPSFLLFYPDAQRKIIVGNMAARAKIFGLEWRSTISLFCDLMQNIAPNFYEEPEISEFLETASDENFSFKMKIIPENAWDRASACIREIPALIPPDSDHLPIHERAATAISVALWDTPPSKIFDLIENAEEAISFFGLPPTDEALLVGAGWAHFCGEHRKNPQKYRWIGDICASHLPSSARLAALRARLMLDFKRRV